MIPIPPLDPEGWQSYQSENNIETQKKRRIVNLRSSRMTKREIFNPPETEYGLKLKDSDNALSLSRGEEDDDGGAGVTTLTDLSPKPEWAYIMLPEYIYFIRPTGVR